MVFLAALVPPSLPEFVCYLSWEKGKLFFRNMIMIVLHQEHSSTTGYLNYGGSLKFRKYNLFHLYIFILKSSSKVIIYSLLIPGTNQPLAFFWHISSRKEQFLVYPAVPTQLFQLSRGTTAQNPPFKCSKNSPSLSWECKYWFDNGNFLGNNCGWWCVQICMYLLQKCIPRKKRDQCNRINFLHSIKIT